MKKLLLFLLLTHFATLVFGQCLQVSTLAGNIPGYADGTGTAASLRGPIGGVVDASGNLYVADNSNLRIRKITPAGVVTTFAGSGTVGSADGTGTAAQFRGPSGIAIDASGNLYVADNYAIRKITPAGVVTTLAGSSTSGYADGTGAAAKFNGASGLVLDASNNLLYVTDNNRIRKVTLGGVVTPFAGSGAIGSANGTGTAATFFSPGGIAMDGSGNLYVADAGNNRIRMITPAGVVTTFAGSTQGYQDGSGTSARFNTPNGVAVDGAGNVYVADTYNNLIRKITSGGVVSTLAGSTVSGTANGTPTAARFNNPRGVSLDASGNLYIMDYLNDRVRKITVDNNMPTPTLTNNGPVCATNPIQLNASSVAGAASYFWTGPNNFTSTQQNPTIASASTAHAGNFTFTLVSASGCSLSVSTTVSIYGFVPPVATSNGPLCLNTTLTLKSTAVTNATYSWTGPNNFTSNLQNPTIANVTAAESGDYIVTATNSVCTMKDTVGVLVVGAPNITGPATSCKDTSFTLTASLPGNLTCSGCSIIWNNQITNNPAYFVASPQGTASYSVFYVLANGCSTQTATHAVEVISYPLQIKGRMRVCPNVNTTMRLYGAPSASTYQWMKYDRTLFKWVDIPGATSVTYTATEASIAPEIGASYRVRVYPTGVTCGYTSPTFGVQRISTCGGFLDLQATDSVNAYNDTITVRLRIESGQDLFSTYAKLRFDAATLRFIDYKTGDYFGTTGIIAAPPVLTVTAVNCSSGAVCGQRGTLDFGISRQSGATGVSATADFYTFRFAVKRVPKADTLVGFWLHDIRAYNASGSTVVIPSDSFAYPAFNEVAFYGQMTNAADFTYINSTPYVWPGDLDNNRRCNVADILPIGYFYNARGPQRPNASIQWTAQPALNWALDKTYLNSPAYRVFADADGSGQVDQADQAAIGFNLNKLRKRDDYEPAPVNKTDGLPVLGVSIPVETLTLAQLPATLQATISLGSTSDPVDSLYGIAFDLTFNAGKVNASGLQVDYSGSIFGTKDVDFIAVEDLSGVAQGRVSVGLTRFGNVPITATGGKVISVSLPVPASVGDTRLQVDARAIDCSKANGERVAVATGTDTVRIGNPAYTGIGPAHTLPALLVYPNPSTGEVTVLLPGQPGPAHVRVLNAMGQQVREQTAADGSAPLTLQLSDLPRGVYLLDVRSGAARSTARLVLK